LDPRRRRRGREQHQLFFILGIVGAILAPLVAALIQFAVSRQREIPGRLVRRLAHPLPRRPGQRLEKIGGKQEAHGSRNSATASLYISNPLKGRSFCRLVRHPPPIEDRVRRLREMEDKQ